MMAERKKVEEPYRFNSYINREVIKLMKIKLIKDYPGMSLSKWVEMKMCEEVGVVLD